MHEPCFDAGGVFQCTSRVLMLEACFDAGGLF